GWYRLMRKHGDGEAALLDARAAIDARVAELDGLGERRERVAADRVAAEAERQRVGAALGQARAKAFTRLAKAVHGELAELGMPKARLTLLDETAEPSALGLRRQEFLICTNPGQAAGRLATVPSGGEAARLTLALAVALAEHDRTPVLVFDEVDSGVGGRLGALIGAKLAAIARGRTVLAVTHTPQLAAAASRQYVVRKNQGDRKTTATVAEVAGEARMAEIADMLGGGTAAVGQARALLAGGAS
nr:DNA repair protein RecN [Planctomycetota bacterium]